MLVIASAAGSDRCFRFFRHTGILKNSWSGLTPFVFFGLFVDPLGLPGFLYLTNFALSTLWQVLHRVTSNRSSEPTWSTMWLQHPPQSKAGG